MTDGPDMLAAALDLCRIEVDLNDELEYEAIVRLGRGSEAEAHHRHIKELYQWIAGELQIAEAVRESARHPHPDT